MLSVSQNHGECPRAFGKGMVDQSGSWQKTDSTLKLGGQFKHDLSGGACPGEEGSDDRSKRQRGLCAEDRLTATGML